MDGAPTIEVKKEKSEQQDRSPELKNKADKKLVPASEELSSNSLKPTPQQSEKSPMGRADASKDAADRT